VVPFKPGPETWFTKQGHPHPRVLEVLQVSVLVEGEEHPFGLADHGDLADTKLSLLKTLSRYQYLHLFR
jgi:hypothetical protein